MEFIAIILLALVSLGHCDCTYRNCHLCTSRLNDLERCKWCEITKSCLSVETAMHTCYMCRDSLISDLCYVTSNRKCGRNVVNGLKSGQFEPYEAFNATLYSAVAYTDEPVKCANKIIEPDQIEIVEVIGRKCNYLFKYKECFAITAVSHYLKKIILSYRGTTSQKQLIEEFLTVLGKFKVSAKIGGKVQEYFSNANDQLYPCVKSSVKDLVNKYPTYGVIIAGHSLGGAIASIASAQLVFDNVIYKENTTLYTFGMPRTGDYTYAWKFPEFITKSWRIVHYRDIVSKLPPRTRLFPSTPYHHLREIFYEEHMGILSDYKECFYYEDPNCGNYYLPSTSSVDYHKSYYGINVGSYCDEQMQKRRKRSDENSDMSHLFTYSACKRIRVAHIATNDAVTFIHGFEGSTLMLLLLSAQIMLKALHGKVYA